MGKGRHPAGEQLAAQLQRTKSVVMRKMSHLPHGTGWAPASKVPDPS
jgi:hypothetical protein